MQQILLFLLCLPTLLLASSTKSFLTKSTLLCNTHLDSSSADSEIPTTTVATSTFTHVPSFVTVEGPPARTTVTPAASVTRTVTATLTTSSITPGGTTTHVFTATVTHKVSTMTKEIAWVNVTSQTMIISDVTETYTIPFPEGFIEVEPETHFEDNTDGRACGGETTNVRLCPRKRDIFGRKFKSRMPKMEVNELALNQEMNALAYTHPAEVKCTSLITIVPLSTITATPSLTSTITATPSPTTITTTVPGEVKVVCPTPITASSTKTTTKTSTTTINSTWTSFSTSTTTTWAACNTGNVLGPHIHGGVAFVKFVGYTAHNVYLDPNAGFISPANITSAYDCCVACQTQVLENCQYSAFLPSQNMCQLVGGKRAACESPFGNTGLQGSPQWQGLRTWAGRFFRTYERNAYEAVYSNGPCGWLADGGLADLGDPALVKGEDEGDGGD